MKMANIKGLLAKYKQIPDERFFKNIFEEEEYKAVLSLKADIVIDIGALAGEFSAYIYPRAKIIYAIEPHSKHYQELTENIKEFDLPKIKPFNLAISNHNNTAELAILSRGGNTLQPTNGEEKIATEVVQCKTLATFMKEQKIDHVDLLKIDIEAHEISVFNSPDFKDVAEKIDCIIGEHVDNGVIQVLKDFGFKNRIEGGNYIFER